MDELIAFLRARLNEDEVPVQHDLRYLGTVLSGGELEAAMAYRRRLLREAEAKRAHIAMYLAQPGYDLPEGVNDGRDDSERLRDEGIKIVLEAVLDHDAAVYSEHPGYRQEWAPETR